MKVYLVLVSSFLLAACNLNLGYRSVPQAWVDAPLDGMVLPLAPYEIVAHASDPGGISQIEINVNGAELESVPGSGPLFTARQAWNPSEPGEYVIQARGMNSSGAWSEYAIVRVTVQGQATPPLEPTQLSPTLTPTSTSTPSVPTLILIQNANCRLGPSQLHEVLTSMLAGDQLPIVGRNEDGTWWLVRLPTGEQCWISAVTGNASGNVNLVPIAEAPPPKGCLVYDPNLQPVCTVPCPENANPGGECTP